MVFACNLRTPRIGAGRLGIHDQLELCRDLEASLGLMKPCWWKKGRKDWVLLWKREIQGTQDFHSYPFWMTLGNPSHQLLTTSYIQHIHPQPTEFFFSVEEFNWNSPATSWSPQVPPAPPSPLYFSKDITTHSVSQARNPKFSQNPLLPQLPQMVTKSRLILLPRILWNRSLPLLSSDPIVPDLLGDTHLPSDPPLALPHPQLIFKAPSKLSFLLPFPGLKFWGGFSINLKIKLQNLQQWAIKPCTSNFPSLTPAWMKTLNSKDAPQCGSSVITFDLVSSWHCLERPPGSLSHLPSILPPHPHPSISTHESISSYNKRETTT